MLGIFTKDTLDGRDDWGALQIKHETTNEIQELDEAVGERCSRREWWFLR